MDLKQVTLSLQNFKTHYSYDVFTYYMKITPSLDKAIKSPFRDEDNNLDFNLYKDNTGEYFFQDAIIGSGSCLKFLILLKKLDYDEAVNLLQSDFNFILSSEDLNTQPIVQPIQPEQPSTTTILTDDQLNKFFKNTEEYYQPPILNRLFMVKPLNKFLEESKKKPMPDKLFDEFWFSGETCIMFSDSNYGKSSLAVQIADSISKGVPIPGFELTAPRQCVIYIDFELSSKQLEIRYSDDNHDSYPFDNRLIRATIDLDSLQEGNIRISDDLILDAIEELIAKSDAKVIILDNLTYLATETEKAKIALPLMKLIQQLKLRYEVSILAIGHTPKRDPSRPMTKNDLQGSKMYMNFCDSSFAINQSFKDTSLRYIKQIKVRNAEFKYDLENVVVCRLNKTNNFLGFEFAGYSSEREHLKTMTEKALTIMEESIIELKKDNPSMSNREIATQLGTNHSKVGRVLNKAEQVEQAEHIAPAVPTVP